MKAQRTREVWWTHNKWGEVTTWAWISKPISPGEMLLNINKPNEEHDTDRICWNMLKVENNINRYIITWHCNCNIHLGIEMEKPHLIWHTSTHQLLSDLVSPVSLSKKKCDVMEQLNVFFPRYFSPVFLGQLHCLLRSQIQCIAGCTQQGHCIQTQGTWKQLLKGLEKPTQEQHKTYMIQTTSPKINIVMASFHKQSWLCIAWKEEWQNEETWEIEIVKRQLPDWHWHYNDLTSWTYGWSRNITGRKMYHTKNLYQGT